MSEMKFTADAESMTGQVQRTSLVNTSQRQSELKSTPGAGEENCTCGLGKVSCRCILFSSDFCFNFPLSDSDCLHWLTFIPCVG